MGNSLYFFEKIAEKNSLIKKFDFLDNYPG